MIEEGSKIGTGEEMRMRTAGAGKMARISRTRLVHRYKADVFVHDAMPLFRLIRAGNHRIVWLGAGERCLTP